MNGQAVSSQEHKQTGLVETTIDLSAMPSGMYLLTLNAGNETTTKRLVIK